MQTYYMRSATDPRKIFKVGINFSSKTGTVDGFEIEE